MCQYEDNKPVTFVTLETVQRGRVCTGFNWLRIWTSGGLLWTRWYTFAFHRRRLMSWPDERLSSSQGRFCSMELFNELLWNTRKLSRSL